MAAKLRYGVRMSRWAAAVVALTCLVHPRLAFTQDSRIASLEQQRQKKAAALKRYVPGRIEKALLYVERENPLRKIAPYNGFFVRYGYQSKPVGSGIGASAGFRHDLFDRRARVLVEGGGTWRGYWMTRGDFSLPYLADDRIELGVELSKWHNPEEDFFGLGVTSLESDRVNYLFDRREAQGRAIARPFDGFSAGGRLGYMNVDVGPGTDTRFPSIEQRFDNSEAPGLIAQPNYLYGELFAAMDHRDQPGNPRAGGYYALVWRRYADQDFDRYSFRFLDADLQHFVPFFDKKRVFALRAHLMDASPGDGQVTPFYFRPTVGGADSLRSVRDYRFRDNSAFIVNLEYRWEAFSGLDMALFADGATVAARAADLALGDLEHALGIGFRFNTFRSVFLRVDAGLFGTEAPKLYIRFNKVF